MPLIVIDATGTITNEIDLNSTADTTVDLDVDGAVTESTSGSTVTLSGLGSLVLSDNANNRIVDGSYNSVLENQQTIEGAGQIYRGGDGLSLINGTTGIIDATGTTYGLSINSVARSSPTRPPPHRFSLKRSASLTMRNH